MDDAPPPKASKTLRALCAGGVALLVVTAVWARTPGQVSPSLPPETPPARAAVLRDRVDAIHWPRAQNF